MADELTGGAGLRIAAVELRGKGELRDALWRFYADRLGFAVRSAEGGELQLAIGKAELAFVASDASAFYHFAFNVPSARFEAAREWAAARVELLPGGGGDPVFDFPDWSARAVYFHDPAGNIVELIAHDAHDAPAGEPFGAAELDTISEVGLVVGEPRRAAGLLDREAGLALWSGTADGPDALGFIGRRAHTLIVVSTGRGWLPTGRPAEAHPVAITVAGPALHDRTVTVETHTVTTRPR